MEAAETISMSVDMDIRVQGRGAAVRKAWVGLLDGLIETKQTR